MKKTMITMLAIAIAAFNTPSQAQGHEHSDKKKKGKEAVVIRPYDTINDSVKAQISSALDHYYQIKDALVAGNDRDASKHAKAFRSTLELVDIKKMTAEQHSFFMPLQKKLDYDAEHIKGSPNIEHMREHLVSFSDNMFLLVKSFNATNGKTVYMAHCPMYNKGANWLSSDEAIKNPYYGKQMLTCGKVTETIK